MHPALFLVAALAAEPADRAFSFEVASPVVWIPVNEKPTPVEWQDFFKVRRDGRPPKDGVFQVDGRPVQPEVEWLNHAARRSKRGLPVAVGANLDGQFALRVLEPGRYTFKASVGKVWSARMTIEVVALPFRIGMRKPDFLEKFGNPDASLVNGRWLYKRWTGIAAYEDPRTGMQVEPMSAEAWQAYLMAAVSNDADPANDLAVLVGVWDVKVGDGYHGVWVFRADGSVLKDGRSPGKWVATSDQIKISWTNDGAWESFFRPVSAKRVTGNSMRGEGLVLGVKAMP
jgi:hypothetical protein